jgi:hypothetical protein
MSIEAMRQALEALEIVVVDVKTTPTAYEAHRQAIAALRAAIEAAEKPAAVSDAAIEAWAERHDIQGTATDLRCMFEDAASFTAAPVLEPVAWREFDGEGGYTYSDYQYNETWRDAYIKRNGEKYANWVEPLYTAAPAAQPAQPAQQGMTIDASAPMVMTQHPAFAHRPAAQRQLVGLTEQQKQELAENWFAEDWAITKAIGMMYDHEVKLKENNHD